MTVEFKGGCLCGEIRYESSLQPVMTGHCHCIDCRKSSGTGHGTHVVIPSAGFSLAGEPSKYEHAADSGNIVTRNFCPVCGAALYSTNSGVPDMAFIRASSLDDPEVAQPQMAVYASRAPSWDYIDPKLPSFPLMPPGGAEEAIAEHS